MPSSEFVSITTSCGPVPEALRPVPSDSVHVPVNGGGSSSPALLVGGEAVPAPELLGFGPPTFVPLGAGGLVSDALAAGALGAGPVAEPPTSGLLGATLGAAEGAALVVAPAAAPVALGVALGRGALVATAALLGAPSDDEPVTCGLPWTSVFEPLSLQPKPAPAMPAINASQVVFEWWFFIDSDPLPPAVGALKSGGGGAVARPSLEWFTKLPKGGPGQLNCKKRPSAEAP